jgi:long-chain fatty acid transport protein
MKRTIKLAVAAAVALTSTAAFATNGDTLIGTGAKARGMGGAGIGISFGAESALSNPAMISTVKGTEVSFGGTVFMPDVESNIGATANHGDKQSGADLSVIPEVSIAQKVSDNFYWGIGMFGTAGMGVDYRDVDGNSSNNYHAASNLQLMQFAIPLAYKVDGLTLSVAPVVQYGSLDIDYDSNPNTATKDSSTRGMSSDLGYGYTVGLGYETSGLTLGAVYKSAIDMEYRGQISKAASDFSQGGLVVSDHLEQPAEYGLGASYTTGGHTLAADFKRIVWSDAKGYKDFQWLDQNVYVVGYQFAQDNWAVRVGYNHADSPIAEQIDQKWTSLYNTFNLLMFPGIVEDHYTLGGSYEFSKTTSLDLAYVYAAEVTENFATAGMTATGRSSVTHSQESVSAQVVIKF